MTHAAKPLPRLFCLTLMMMALALAASVRAQDATVTSDGFKELADKSTFYMPVPMYGVMGVDCPAKSVNATLKAAADNKDIKHAVFMIDSESGWPLENEDIGGFQGKLEITAVIRNAVAPAIFPVFFADHIYMTEGALVGGLPLHIFMDKGDDQVTAKQVGIFSSMLASAAQSRGHSPAVAYAMIDYKKQLYTWEEDGKVMLSNDKPSGKSGVERVGSAVPGMVLTLDQEIAEDLGFAKPIDDFDHYIVGEYLGKPNWEPANQFGRVANQIGMVIAELEPLRETIKEIDKQIESVKANRNSSDEEKDIAEFKRSLDKAAEQIEMINESLESLYKTHPERHAYFTGPEGKTILADPEKWNSDLNESRGHLNRAANLLSRLTDDFKNLGGDAEYLYDLNRRMDIMKDHINGIGRHGNASYWRDHAPPDVPDDIYG